MTDGEFKEKESFLAKAESFLAQGLYQTAQDLAIDWLTRFPKLEKLVSEGVRVSAGCQGCQCQVLTCDKEGVRKVSVSGLDM